MVLTRKTLDSWCEYGILSLILAMLVFAPIAFGAVDEWAFLVMEGLGAGVLLLWGARLWVNPQPKLLWPPLAWVVAAFAVYAVGWYLAAEIEYVARLQVIQVLLFAFIFFAVVNNLHRQEWPQLISFTLIALATVISGYALKQLITHSEWVLNQYSPYYPGRAGGTYVCPNNLAGFLEILLPLALAYLLVGRVGIVTRILLGYAVVAMVVGLAATFSRSGWVSAAMGVCLVLGVLLGHRNHRLRALLVLGLILACGAVCVPKFLSKLPAYKVRISDPDPNGPPVLDTVTRLEVWRGAEQMWRDHLWLGVGPAHFDYRFDAYRPVEIQNRPVWVHNDYLNLLVDWGVVGGVIVLSGIGIFIFGLLKTWPHVRRAEKDFGRGQSNRFAFFLGATSGLFALSIHSLTDFNLHVPANALLGVTLLALLAGNVRFATGQRWLRAGLPWKLALTGVFLAVVTVFAADENRRVPETLWLSRADRQKIFSPERAARLQKAFASEPHNFQTAYDIGECYRMPSFQGDNDYATLAQQAMSWYARAMKLDPYDPYNFLRTGMCLDWLDKHKLAVAYYRQAERLDPNGCYTVANIGWHYVQIGDYAAAREYFLRAQRLDHLELISRNYLNITEGKLAERASDQPPLLPDY